MEIFDVFSMNGIENYCGFFLENVILKVSQTRVYFSNDFYPKGGGGINFQWGGAVKYPE